MTLSKKTAPSQINSSGSNKQDLLISGTNIKTINGTSLLGPGDITAGVSPLTEVIFVDSGIGDNATADGSIGRPYQTVEYVLANVINTGTVTATTTNTSATLTSVSSTSSIEVGQYITGTGIPFGTICVSKTSNTIVLSQPCTASATITATWYQPYNVVLTGTHTWVSEWNKIGFYIINKGTAIVGNGTMFGGSTVYPIQHKITNEGLIIGNHANSRIINMTGTQLDGFDIVINVGRIQTIGTGIALTTSLGSGEIRCKVIGVFVNCVAGTVGSFSGTRYLIEFNSYGLLGGITTSAGSMTSASSIGILLKGNHTSSATVLTAGSYTIANGVYRGNVVLGSFTELNGRVSGSTITMTGAKLRLSSRSEVGTITSNGGYIDTSDAINISFSSGTTYVYGTTIITGHSSTATVYNFGSMSKGDFASGGVLYNYGVIGGNNYMKLSSTARVYNFGELSCVDLEPDTTSGFIFENRGRLILAVYGMLLGASQNGLYGTCINYGTIYMTSNMSNRSAFINNYNANGVFKNYGQIIHSNAVNTVPVFELGNGKTYFYAGSKIDVGNAKSPIKIPIVDSGTATSTTANKLVQTGQNFLTTVGVGCKVKNTTDNTWATVTAVDSNTQLSLDTDIMTSGETFEIYGNPNIYNFGTTTNCDGSTYGLLIAFDGSSIAPVDLVGGTIYENTAY